MSVLNSLSAYQMYRQYSLDRVTGSEVVTFLLKDVYFPRAVASCLEEIGTGLLKLPRRETVVEELQVIQRILDNANIEQLDKDQLHQLVDDLQVEFSELNGRIAAVWFQPQVSVAR